MFSTGMRLKPKCPNCGSFMYYDNDSYESYLVCSTCAREFDSNLIPRRITPKELLARTGIELPCAVEVQ